MKKISKQRFWEIDFLRGIAIIMMIVFHFLFNLVFFFNYSIVLNSGFWNYFRIACASLFLLLVGVSLTLSYNRKKENKNLFKFFKRGGIIFLIAMLLTLITYLVMPKTFIIFGILHLIGLAIIISYPFLRLKYLNFLFGIIFIVLGNYFKTIFIKSQLLFWVGLKYPGFYSLDYYPLFPWIGIVLIGVGLGNIFYVNNKRKLNLIDLSQNIIVKSIAYFGKKSLSIYLIHQPIMLGVMYLIVLI